jgi:uncharacterized protein (DUF111 family)
MKKGRSAHTLHVLAPTDRAPELRAAVFAETSTIGLRETVVGKHALDRETGSVDVDGQPVRIKRATLAGRTVNVSVEYDDVLAAADALGIPPKQALQRAQAEAQTRSQLQPSWDAVPLKIR